MKKSGFTLIEILVVVAIIAIIAAILLPVISKARERARMTTCANNQHQIAQAIMIYTQENGGAFPFSDSWDIELGQSLDQKLFQCPNNESNKKSYGISSHLFQANGQGIFIVQVTDPSNVGLLIDITAEIDTPSEELLFPTMIEPDLRHDGGVVISFLDGHTEIMTENERLDPSFYNSEMARAFYYPPAVGYIQENYAGYMNGDMIGDETVETEIYGTPENQLPIQAIAEWSAAKGSMVNINSTYFSYIYDDPASLSTTYDLSNISNLIYAYDAVVIISCNRNKRERISSNDLRDMYGDGASETGLDDNGYTLYALPENSIISATFKEQAVYGWSGGANGVWAPFTGDHVIIIDSPAELIQAVMADDKAIGYAPAYMVDPDAARVLILDGVEYSYGNKEWTMFYPMCLKNSAATAGLRQFMQMPEYGFYDSPLFSSLLLPPSYFD